MEEQKESESVRVPSELNIWVEEIQKEFQKLRGFTPNKPDIIRNIVKQFKGKFIV
jgi:hypothetical protein